MIIKFSKFIVKSLFLFSIFFVCNLGTNAQEIDSSRFFDPIFDDISKKIPPLEALIDSAIANSPEILIEELKAAGSRYGILSARRDWTHYIEIVGGLNGSAWFQTDRDELILQNNWYAAESRRNSYNFGVIIKLPLYFMIDRKNNINKQKKNVEIAIVQREVIVRAIRKNVISTYNALLQEQEIMKISNDYQQTSDIMMQNADIMFRNGEIPPEEYNRQKDYQTRGASQYALTIGRFNHAYTLLEELVGFKFNLINVLN